MMSNFNQLADRRQSDSEKWRIYGEDLIPMWVADADYAAPEAVIEALNSRLAHPVLGYGIEPQRLRELIVAHLRQRHHWYIEPEWIAFSCGVVPSLNGCRALMGAEGSKAITALPVYPHLRRSAPALKRPMQLFPMKNVAGRFTPDFEALEAAIDADTRMLILCNPHNPVGTVYDADELARFADIAERHDLLICSDDIHADFALYKDKPYRPIASLSPAVSRRTITLMAPSKTFNIAGLNCSFAVIEDADLRRRFTDELAGLVGGVNILGFVAAEAAYEHGQTWLDEQLLHLRANAEYCRERINAMPYLHMNAMEATYLAWVDASELNAVLREKGDDKGGEKGSDKSADNAHDYFLQFGVAVSDGAGFGDGGYFRLNLATSRDLLTQGLDRIERGINAL